MQMKEGKMLSHCEICDRNFQFDQHRYDGLKNQTYGIMVCLSCHDANWDGWRPDLEPLLTKKLMEKGVPLPQRNKNGLLPRG